jgi:hypothetical protein
MIAAAKAIGYGRATFDRCEQLRVQPQRKTVVVTDYGAIWVESCGVLSGRTLPPHAFGAFVNDPLDLHAQRRQVTRLFLRHESL